jgi:hypothetical protein
MEIQANSRFITYPSTVEKSNNHTVVLIDADTDDVENLVLFCQNSIKNYDVYLYRHDLHDLEWLAHITDNCDMALINNSSGVTITNLDALIRYGGDTETVSPLDYFSAFDSN